MYNEKINWSQMHTWTVKNWPRGQDDNLLLPPTVISRPKDTRNLMQLTGEAAYRAIAEANAQANGFGEPKPAKVKQDILDLVRSRGGKR